MSPELYALLGSISGILIAALRIYPRARDGLNILVGKPKGEPDLRTLLNQMGTKQDTILANQILHGQHLKKHDEEIKVFRKQLLAIALQRSEQSRLNGDRSETP